MHIRPHSRQSFLILVVVALWVVPAESQAKKQGVVGPRGLDRRMEAVLRRSEAGRGFWGIEVVRLSSGKILYARDPDHLFQPASNMKLFTTAAAIEKLGPDFVFRTTVESETPPDPEGRVGELYLVGRGDPDLSGRLLPYQLKNERREPADAALENLADQVSAQGIHEIGGNLVADDRYFLFEPFSHDWAEEDLVWGYGAPVTALAFNDNALVLHVRPGTSPGERAQVWTDPVAEYYKLQSHVETVAASAPKRIFVERAGGSMGLDVWGEVPLGASADDSEGSVAIADPPQLAGELFRRALERRGITVRGQVEVLHFTRFEAAIRRDEGNVLPRVALAEHVSLPLREDIKVINKVSQNLHAEMLLRTLGREIKNYGSLTVGLQVLQEFSSQAGMEKGETNFADGSGLSRQALTTPHAVVKLLQYMARSPRFEVFLDSLPVAAVDGTLADRFHHTPAEGRIRAKTGTIEHVNCLSGYMDLPSGERLAFSIMGNSHGLDSKGGEEIIDQMALAIFEWYTRHKRLR